MREVKYTARFKRDYRREKSGWLAQGETLRLWHRRVSLDRVSRALLCANPTSSTESAPASRCPKPAGKYLAPSGIPPRLLLEEQQGIRSRFRFYKPWRKANYAYLAMIHVLESHRNRRAALALRRPADVVIELGIRVA
jgi:hypothetical protein